MAAAGCVVIARLTSLLLGRQASKLSGTLRRLQLWLTELPKPASSALDTLLRLLRGPLIARAWSAVSTGLSGVRLPLQGWSLASSHRGLSTLERMLLAILMLPPVTACGSSSCRSQDAAHWRLF